MIVPTSAGPAVAVAPTTELVQRLDWLRLSMLHRGLPVPAELDELADDARRALMLTRLGVSVSAAGHLVAPGQPAAAQWVPTAVMASLLGVSDRTVRRWCRSGLVPEAQRTPAGQWLVPASTRPPHDRNHR